jgi:predicted  nucleic acid-binding Zn-ribbon protein
MISSITCQHCGKVFEAEIVSKTELCLHCGKETSVLFVAEAPAPPSNPTRKAAARAAGTPDGLRLHADNIGLAAIICLILAGIVFVATAITTIDASQETAAHYWANGLSIAGSLCSLAVALYVIAQIVHIRANTLK